MTPAPSHRPARRGSARGVRFGDPRRPETVIARQREVLAVEYRRQGLSVPEIAARLGLTRQGAWEVLDRIRRRHRPSSEIAIEAMTLDATRLDRLLVAVMPRALSGRHSYIRAAVSLIEMRQGLIGALQAAIRRAAARP